MTNWRLGTMGFSYPDWEGPFYPRGLRSGDYLSYYARYFDAVELDTTFHAAPTAERVRRWAAATPDNFEFCVKTPKDVTHGPSLARAGDAMRRFVDGVRTFRKKLACVLLQFPPNFGAGEAASLRAFLGELPRDLRFAVEFRHDSWTSDATADLLREHGCAWVAADYVTREPWSVRVTADFAYVRWVGEHGRFPTHQREQVDVTERLEWWKQQLDGAAGLKRAWGFFNNDYSGYSVGACNRMKSAMGLKVRRPGAADRGELFG